MYIPVIVGTGREGRQSEKAAKFVLEEFQKTGTETELLDVRSYPFDVTNNQSPHHELREKIAKAAGYIIVSPEYNHGYPGELKQFLDQFYEEYNRKPVAICGVSMGPLGGARMVEQLRLVAIELQLVPVRNAVYFASVQDLFDEAGAMQDPAPFQKKVQTLFAELLWYANALKDARESRRP